MILLKRKRKKKWDLCIYDAKQPEKKMMKMIKIYIYET